LHLAPMLDSLIGGSLSRSGHLKSLTRACRETVFLRSSSTSSLRAASCSASAAACSLATCLACATPSLPVNPPQRPLRSRCRCVQEANPLSMHSVPVAASDHICRDVVLLSGSGRLALVTRMGVGRQATRMFHWGVCGAQQSSPTPEYTYFPSNIIAPNSSSIHER